MYQAVIDLAEALANTKYVREDGAELMHRWIAFDANWQTDHILRAIRESRHRSMLVASQGVFYGVKDRPMMEGAQSDREIHYHCFTTQSSDRVVPMLKMDTNNLKSLVHRGFITRPGTIGSYKLFSPDSSASASGFHNLLADHLCNESPERKINLKDNRVVVEWKRDTEAVDNEYLDNFVGATALLFKCGCTLRATKEIKRVNMQDYMRRKE
jgi:hypothetical protein